jgi:rSAM/selenodomain-associated transferase 1
MNTALVIFAKAPVAGLAKTRMIPALDAQGSARLAQQQLLHAVQQAAQVPWDALALCVSPDTTHPAFALAQELVHKSTTVTPQCPLSLSLQGDGDLGQRMHRALVRGLSQHAAVMLMGTDAPGLNAAMLQQAALALQTHDAVFVPAHDGGYALVGLRRPAPELFEDMVWSTAGVMAETRMRAHRAGLRWCELAPVHDMDEPTDLQHLPPDWPHRSELFKAIPHP